MLIQKWYDLIYIRQKFKHIMRKKHKTLLVYVINNQRWVANS